MTNQDPPVLQLRWTWLAVGAVGLAVWALAGYGAWHLFTGCR